MARCSASAGVEVAAPAQLVEGLERVRRAHAVVVAAVHELQELDRELDVPDPTRPPLELVGPLRLGARLHLSELPQRVGVEGAVPHRGQGGVEEPAGDRGVARHGAALDERLTLPVAGPVAVVVAEERHRARQRPGAALGPQVGVGAEHHAAGRLVVHDPEQAAGDADGLVAVELVAVVDEQDVDVGGVVQLRAAELAHADHHQCLRERARRREVARHAAGGRVGAGQPQRGGQAGVGQARQLPADRRQVRPAEQVAQRGAGELPPLPVPQGEPVGEVGGAGRIRLRRALGAEGLRLGQAVEQRRVGDGGLAERAGGVDQRHEAAEGQLVGGEPGGEVGSTLDQALQRRPGGRRVGCARDDLPPARPPPRSSSLTGDPAGGRARSR